MTGHARCVLYAWLAAWAGADPGLDGGTGPTVTVPLSCDVVGAGEGRLR